MEIISDQGTHFVNEVVEVLLNEFMVTHRRSAPYPPQANGQAESTNKVLCAALTTLWKETEKLGNVNSLVSYVPIEQHIRLQWDQPHLNLFMA